MLRHAKSSWDDPSLDDFDRPLNDRGRVAARRMGREFARRQLEFDLVVASTAQRVRETIDLIRETFALTAPVRFEKQLYLAGEELLLEVIRNLPDMIDRALLVGHNPGFERLIVDLAHDDDADARNAVATKFPTAGLAMIELPADRWSMVKKGSGTIAELIIPSRLD